MTNNFTDVHPTLDNYWRAIILFGQNTACYKFALAQSLLEFASEKSTQISFDDLGERYAAHICNHLQTSNIQGVNPSNSFLAACSKFNDGEIDKDRLIETAKTTGFRYVFDAFHN
jgi:hypothetical protein